jgi:hypothetical protein
LFHSRPMPFQQRTNTSCYLAIPTHGFTVVLSVFWGTPPAKPLNCKSVSNRLGARSRSVWAHHTGGTPRHSCDRFRLALSDILKTSLSFHSQFRLPFVLIVYFTYSDNKKPCLLLVSRVIEILCSIRYLLTFTLSKLDSGVLPPYGLDSLRLNTQPWLVRL